MNTKRKNFLPNRKGWLILPVLTVMATVITGCYYDKAELLYPDGGVDCSAVQATYTKVQTIMAAKCNGCHSARNAAGGTVLETYDQVKSKAGRIRQRSIVEKTMPPAGPLSSEEIAILECWISSGAPNN
ncbi:hypothetical protein [Niastella populi]|uniref:Cytochrome c domain-containing protein n=1 Tax=Niastella populi TaxID=550983 RepID=A0A1V9FL59_9BACT|nr:hypothetical protein [Niastella populi]OQP59027.1 hypothetical protein A4R26_21810 [Niastella populi]